MEKSCANSHRAEVSSRRGLVTSGKAALSQNGIHTDFLIDLHRNLTERRYGAVGPMPVWKNFLGCRRRVLCSEQGTQQV
jgi:hypothetical protein